MPIDRRLPERAACAAVALLVLAAVAGCASTQESDRQIYQGPRLARPDRILVYDFVSSPDQIPPESPLAGQIAAPETLPTAEEQEVARQLGVEVAKKLAEEITEMGLNGVRATDQPPVRPGEIVIMGYFLSVDEGSAFKRIVIGFGSGAAELKTYVEGYEMTERGLRRLGSGEIDSGSRGGTPGAVIPIAVTIATANPIGLVVGGAAKAVGELAGTQKIQASAERTAEKIGEELRPAFERQGWIEED